MKIHEVIRLRNVYGGETTLDDLVKRMQGNKIHRVPTMYPSSQTCSCCGYRNPRIKNLGIRIWECPKCHAVHDRDTNASINILKKGLQMQSA